MTTSVAPWTVERCACGAQYFGPGPCPLCTVPVERPARIRAPRLNASDLNGALRDLAREFRLSIRTEHGVATIRLRGYGAHRRGQVRPHIGMLSEFTAYLQVPKDDRGRPGSLPTGLAARGLRDSSGEGYLRAEGPAGALVRYAQTGPSWLRPVGRGTPLPDDEKGRLARGCGAPEEEPVPGADPAAPRPAGAR